MSKYNSNFQVNYNGSHKFKKASPDVLDSRGALTVYPPENFYLQFYQVKFT